jgi:lactate dehydrogenase-like 2-hydroxyacid dehydrogenase
MAKKRQREAELTQSYETYLDTATKDHVLKTAENSDLFSIDRIGSKNSRRKIDKNELKKEKNDAIVSNLERKQINKIIASKSRSKKPKIEQKVTDLWEEEEDGGAAIVGKKKQKKVALKIPMAGISYNPSHVDHQDAIAEV